MLGSPFRLPAEFVLITVIAEVLRRFADELAKEENFESALNRLLRRVTVEHKRIVFNGNSCSQEWKKRDVRACAT